MIFALLFAVLSAGAIYAASEAFTNGVEWLGRKLSLGQTATGTVLAALATGLPEGVVTLVATAFGHSDAERAVGVGAAMGGPLALSTIAYGVTGFGILASERRGRPGTTTDPAIFIATHSLRGNQIWFLSIFAVVVGLGTLQFHGKAAIGFVLLILYGLYVRQEIAAEPDAHASDMEPLMIRRASAEPALAWVLLQVALAVGVTFLASELFVGQLTRLAADLHLSPQLAALLLSPLATELPETMNAVIWCRQGKQRLALANIGGAMIVQCTLPAACGLLFTPWMFDRSALIAGLVTLFAASVLLALLYRPRIGGRTLAPLGLLYLVFIGLTALFAR